MTVHVIAHTWRAGRLATADLRASGRHRNSPSFPRLRQGVVLASLAAGVLVAVSTRGLASAWLSWAHRGH